MLQDMTSGGHANMGTSQRSDSHESRIGLLQILKCDEDGQIHHLKPDDASCQGEDIQRQQ